MGLRINTNVTALQALRTLGVNDRHQARSLERLSTGLRINRGADDPSGLVISEQLRAQLRALNQAVDNSQNASNLVSTADAALQEASNLLVQIQDSIVFAQNTGGSTPDQIAAEQNAVDQAIAAIDRIANTTRFADRELLNGSSEFQITASIPDFFDNLTIRSVNFPGTSFTRNLTITAQANPQRASLQVTGASSNGGTIRVTGPRGTSDVILASNSGATQIASAINGVAGFTGVFASAVGGTLYLRSEDFGSSQLIKLEAVSAPTVGGVQQGAISSSSATGFTMLDSSTVSGAFVQFTPSVGQFLAPGEVVSDRGRDGTVLFEGQIFTGIGNKFSILSPTAQFEFQIDPDLITSSGVSTAPTVPTGGPFSFTVANTGLNFQMRELPLPTDRLGLGINSINTNRLGIDIFRDHVAEAEAGFTGQISKGGALNSIKTGAGNDLTQNAANAQSVVKGAITQIASLRGFLGAVQANAIEPNIDSLGVEIENLTASLSDLRDLDFAAETSEFTRTQILFQSGIAVLASANLIPQSVLTLLG